MREFIRRQFRRFRRRKGMGYKPDNLDPRDQPFDESRVLARPPSSDSLRKHVKMVLDQSYSSSCVGHAVEAAVRIAYAALGSTVGLRSVLFIYYYGRAESGLQGVDKGSYIRDVIKAFIRFGAPDAKYWPFNLRKVNTRPNYGSSRHAYDNRGPKNYRRIFRTDPDRLDQIRQAVSMGNPVVFGVQVGREFQALRSAKPIGPPSKATGGHCMVVIGYDDKGNFEILNSWGERWGGSGFCWITTEYMESATDLWVMDVER